MGNQFKLRPLHNYVPWYLLLFAAAAVIIGTVARFKGLGTWPFNADEYYFAKSVENLLRFGLPMYECGGYYFRGVLAQYLAAGLQLVGFSAELAPRVVAATMNLVALPAIFILGRRVAGTTVGVLAVSLVAISVWEIEIARFGRMYAPFQTVFLWYLVFFVQYTADKKHRALWGMVVLSIIGVLMWEGGALLAVANLLPPFINNTSGRLRYPQVRHIVLMALLLIPIYWFATFRFRLVGDTAPLPPDFASLVPAAASKSPAMVSPIWMELPNMPLIAAVLLSIALLSVAAVTLPWTLQYRSRPLLMIGLFATLVAALLHQFLIVVVILTLLLLCRMCHWQELLRQSAVRFLVSILVAAIIWASVGLAVQMLGGEQDPRLKSIAVTLGYKFFGFPDFLEVIARPWARAVPVLGVSLLLFVTFAAARIILSDDADSSTAPDAERVLLIVAISMILLVSASDPPRSETRYVFFLYPLLLIIAISTIYHVIESLVTPKRIAGIAPVALVLGWYMLTEDFQPGHLRNIDTKEVNFRQNMSAARRNHYIGRTDRRAVAEWLVANANPQKDLIISGNGVSALDYYYSGFDFVYVDPSDHRLFAWACRQGTVDRWSNLPMEYSKANLESRIAESPRAFIVIDERKMDLLTSELEHLRPSVVWENRYGREIIVRFQPD
jgi:hypothetical protein